MTPPKHITVVHLLEGFVEGGVFAFLKKIVNGSPDHLKHIIVHSNRGKTEKTEELKSQFKNGTEFVFWASAQRSIHPFYDALALIQLITISRRLIQKKDNTVFHLHSSKAGFLGRVALSFLRHPKVLYTSHGAAFLMPPKGIKKKLFILLERVAHRFGGKVIAVSESEKKAFQNIGIPSHCIYNGIDIHPYVAQRQHKEPLTVINVGRIAYQKNPILFNAIAKHFKNNHAIRFLWVGDGELKPILSSNNITITGWVNAEKINAYLSSAHLFLSSSRYEGLSIAILEAMTHELPLVLSNCVGNCDMVHNKVNGYLYNTAEEAVAILEHLLASPSHLEQQGKASQQLCLDKFNIDNTIKEYVSLYSQFFS